MNNENFELSERGAAEVSSYSENEKRKIEFRGTDTVFALLALVVGFLFCRAAPITQNSLGGMLTVWMLYAFGWCYFYRSGIRITGKAAIFAGVACCFSSGLVLGANKTLQTCLFLFLFFSFFYWCYCACGLKGERFFEDNGVMHALYALFALPVTSVIYWFMALGKKGKNEKGYSTLRTVGWIGLGLCVAFIPTMIILLLLSYDDQFTSLLNKIFSWKKSFEYIGDLFWGAVMAIILFGVLFGAMLRRNRNNGEPQKVGKAYCHVFPRALLCAAVTPILLVYVLFFVSQWDYYVSAFTHVLPAHLTYAEYARSGFFQLCWVCGINAVMLLLFNVLIRENGKKRDWLRTVYSLLISVFTLILIATALSKMALYIDSFGLTRLRVYASWFMVLLAVIFVLLVVHQFVRRIPFVASAVAVFVVLFGLIAVPNVDGMIARYNVNAYLSTDLVTVDANSLIEYGASAVPALMDLKSDLEERENPTENDRALLKEVTDALTQIDQKMEEDSDHIFAWNLPKMRAKRLLAETLDP